jgi:hypothetical protein
MRAETACRQREDPRQSHGGPWLAVARPPEGVPRKRARAELGPRVFRVVQRRRRVEPGGTGGKPAGVA